MKIENKIIEGGIEILPQSVEKIEQPSGIDGVYDIIERCARVCYQSSLSKMPSREWVECVLLKNAHGRPLEFGTVYLKVCDGKLDMFRKYENNAFSKVVMTEQALYITTNLRVIMQGDSTSWQEAWQCNFENSWAEDLEYLTEPCDKHEKRLVFRFIVSNPIHTQLKTHTSLSSMGESTRFCDYTKGKFKNTLRVVAPLFYGNVSDEVDNAFESSVRYCWEAYRKAIENGLKPQDARVFLPKSHRTETIMCGFERDWQNFLWIRNSPKAQPEMIELAREIERLMAND